MRSNLGISSLHNEVVMQKTNVKKESINLITHGELHINHDMFTV